MFADLSGTLDEGVCLMARKQSDYLAGLLANETPTPLEKLAIPLAIEDAPPLPRKLPDQLVRVAGPD